MYMRKKKRRDQGKSAHKTLLSFHKGSEMRISFTELNIILEQSSFIVKQINGL